MSSNFNIRAVVFDVGGVLLRNMVPEQRTQLGQKHGMTGRELESLVFDNPVAVKASVGEASPEDMWNYVGEALKLDPTEMPAFTTKFWSSDRLDEDLVDFIRSLRPGYKTGLLSNAWSDTRRILDVRYPQLMKVFDVSIFSAEVGLAKPDERIYRLILGQLGVSPNETVFVDDFIENIDAARKIGIHGVHFKNPTQALRDVRELISENGTEE